MLTSGIEIDIESIQIEDMPNSDMVDIAAVCGIEAAVNILMYFCGSSLYIPINGFDKLKKRIIEREYDGTTRSMKLLSRKLRMTERSVRTVLESLNINPVVEGQMSLFGNNEVDND